MTQEIELKQKSERSLVTPIDIFQAAKFSTGIFTSGHVASGLSLVSVVSPTNIRPLNLELFNQDAGWIEVEFRNGGLDGGRVLGPYVLNARSERRLSYDEVVGRYFTSGIHMTFLSGYTATPLSAGIKVNISYIKEVTEPLT